MVQRRGKTAADRQDVTHSPAVQVLVLVVEGEAGHLPLQVSKLWLHRHVGTEEEATQNIPEAENKVKFCVTKWKIAKHKTDE